VCVIEESHRGADRSLPLVVREKAGTSSCIKSASFGTTPSIKKLTPVMLPKAKKKAPRQRG